MTGFPVVGRTGLEPSPPGAPGASRAPTAGTPSFADELVAAGQDRGLTLSGHALRRLEQRGIDVGEPELDRLGKAMDMLAARGGRQSLVMLDQVAYVVHVPSGTVITAVAPSEEKEAVFTKIDSVVIA